MVYVGRDCRRVRAGIGASAAISLCACGGCAHRSKIDRTSSKQASCLSWAVCSSSFGSLGTKCVIRLSMAFEIRFRCAMAAWYLDSTARADRGNAGSFALCKSLLHFVAGLSKGNSRGETRRDGGISVKERQEIPWHPGPRHGAGFSGRSVLYLDAHLTLVCTQVPRPALKLSFRRCYCPLTLGRLRKIQRRPKPKTDHLS